MAARGRAPFFGGTIVAKKGFGSNLSKGQKGLVAGCLAFIGNAIAGTFVAILAIGFFVKDTVANYLPDQARSVGLGWLVAPPQAVDPVKTTDTYGCELHWERDLTGDRINWTASCSAKTKLRMENVRLEVFSPNESALATDLFATDAPTIDSVTIGPFDLDDEERFEESGTLKADALGRPQLDAYRTVRFTADVRYPDDTAKPDNSDRYKLRIASTEGE